MNYTNAGHEPVLLIAPDGTSTVLAPTAPLVGVFDDQHHLFRQAFVEVEAGTLFVAATDGVTEARNEHDEFFGIDRFVEAAVTHRARPEPEIVAAILNTVQTFCDDDLRDDIALLAVRFL